MARASATSTTSSTMRGCTDRSGSTRRRGPTSATSRSRPSSRAGRDRRLRGRGRGRRRREVQRHAARRTAPRWLATGGAGELRVEDPHLWRPGEGYLYELVVELRGATETRRRLLLAAGRDPDGRGRRISIPDQRRALLLQGLRQARGRAGRRQAPRRRVDGPRLRADGVDRRELVSHLPLPLRRGGARVRRPPRDRRHRRDGRGRAERLTRRSARRRLVRDLLRRRRSTTRRRRCTLRRSAS